MKRLLPLLVIALLAVPAAEAQSQSFGISIGVAESMEDGFDADLEQSVRELFYGMELERSTIFKIKLGRVDAELAAPGQTPADGRIEWVSGAVEYRFDEVWGATGIFIGPGFYRARAGTFEETDYGFVGGVNGDFPITRRLGFIAELAYHHVNFEETVTFLTASGGLRIRF